MISSKSLATLHVKMATRLFVKVYGVRKRYKKATSFGYSTRTYFWYINQHQYQHKIAISSNELMVFKKFRKENSSDYEVLLQYLYIINIDNLNFDPGDRFLSSLSQIKCSLFSFLILNYEHDSSWSIWNMPTNYLLLLIPKLLYLG